MRTAKLIKDGDFSLDSWSDIIEGINSEDLARLVMAIRNALSYAKENRALRGLVKAGYQKAISTWNASRAGLPAGVVEEGDSAIKEAESFIKKHKLRIE